MSITISGPTSLRDSFAVLVHPLWRRLRPATLLERLLRNYQHYSLPHRGLPQDLTKQQRQANLASFLENKPERLRYIGALLTEFGLNPTPALDPVQDPAPYFLS